MPSAVNDCCGINLSWYTVLSKLASHKCENWRIFVDFLYQKTINIGQYLLKIFEIFVGVRFFEHSVYSHVLIYLLLLLLFTNLFRVVLFHIFVESKTVTLHYKFD